MGRMPRCLRDGFTVAIEQLKGEPDAWYGAAGLSIALHDLKMCRQGVVVYDVLKLCAVSDLLCRDSPFPCLLKAVGHSVDNLTNGVAGTVIRYGSTDAIGALSCAKPCSSLVFGRCEAVDIGVQRSNNLLRSVAYHFKDHAFRRLLYTRPIAIATVLEL